MRMWNVDPRLLCRQHLLGEHVEMHMMAGSLAKGHNLSGYIEDGLIEVHNIVPRHAALAAEMIRRGYNHRSPIRRDVEYYEAGEVDVIRSRRDLVIRCQACLKRMRRDQHDGIHQRRRSR